MSGAQLAVSARCATPRRILGTIVVNVERSGSPFSDDGVFWWRLVSGLWSLGLAFLAFAAVFSLAFVFQSAVVIAGVRPPMAVQIAFQVVLENGMLAAAVWYAYYGDAKDWPWTQKAGLLLEVAVLVLKAHSYLAVNGALSRGSLAGFAASSTALDAMVELEGGAEEADAAARAERSAVEARQRATRDQHDGDSHADDGTSSDSEEEDARQGGSGHNTRSSSTRRRRRRPAAAAAATESPASPVTRRSAAKAAKAADQATASPHDDSSAPRLTQTPSHGADIAYPDNVTLADFVRFACAPTVVYSPNFPSTAAFRPLYLLEKVVFAAILLFAALETAIQFVLPVVADLGRAHAAGSPLPAGLVMARMVVPLTALMLLLFFLVFDVLLNAFAEFTLFGDRRFYGDWWNSTSFAEFSRKWNRPVHTWLLHHVYLPLQEAGLGSAVARYGTFAVSIAAHELVSRRVVTALPPALAPTQPPHQRVSCAAAVRGSDCAPGPRPAAPRPTSIRLAPPHLAPPHLAPPRPIHPIHPIHPLSLPFCSVRCWCRSVALLRSFCTASSASRRPGCSSSRCSSSPSSPSCACPSSRESALATWCSGSEWPWACRS